MVTILLETMELDCVRELAGLSQTEGPTPVSVPRLLASRRLPHAAYCLLAYNGSRGQPGC
jgi:hypothetical protein